MLTETTYEILRYFSRAELEGLQIHSRFLRDIVDHNSRTFPLRSIYGMETGPDGGAEIWSNVSNLYEDNPYKLSVLTHVNLRLLYDRINNAFVQRLWIFSACYSDSVRFLRHLQNHAGTLECRVYTLFIPVVDSPADFDHSLFDAVASELKPQALETSLGWSANSLAAHCVIPGLLNVGTLQTCSVYTTHDATPWIMFEATTRGANVVETVAVVREHSAYVPATASDALKQHAMPQRKGVPTPHSDLVTDIYRCTDVTESNADIFVFTNIHLGKRLDVYKWTAESTETPNRYRCDVFLLNITDI